MKDESQRDEVCDKYKEWLYSEIKNRNMIVINELKRIKDIASNNNVVLLCWCAPKRCHGETIKEVIYSMKTRKILECSSKGDKRFSAMYAKINVFGKFDTIENHYQSCKWTNGHPSGKGKKVDEMIIKKRNSVVKLDPTYLTAYYKLLWCSYLDTNPDLVEYAKTFDDYNDMFKGRAINCQADVIRQYIKQGRMSILREKDIIELRKALGI